jgi:hypothetical protein
MDTNQPRNLLLSSLSPLIIEDVCAAAELVHFDMRENVIEPNQTIGYVDFIDSGVMSLDFGHGRWLANRVGLNRSRRNVGIAFAYWESKLSVKRLPARSMLLLGVLKLKTF